MEGFATLFLMVSHAKIGTSAMARQGARRHRSGTGSPIAAAIAANPLPCGGTWADALREAALPQKAEHVIESQRNDTAVVAPVVD